MKRMKEAALVICGLIMGITLSYLLKKNTAGKDIPGIIQQRDVRSLESDVTTREKEIQFLITAIEKKNISLNDELQSLKLQLRQNRTESRMLQARTLDLARKKPEIKDTALLLADCDTLKEKVVLLNRLIGTENSLCDSITGNQQRQLIQKDSLIQLHRDQYTALKNSFATSIAQQKLLIGENASLSKQLKKQKRKSRFVSAVTFIGAGLASYYLLK